MQTAYAIANPPQTTSDDSDVAPVGSLAAIRAALTARHTSLRGWCADYAARTGSPPSAAYALARATIARRLARGLAPLGAGGRALLAALRADLGVQVVPEFPHTAPAGRPAATEGDHR